MNKGQKTKYMKLCAQRLQEDRERTAENRRKLLAKLKPEVREFAVREFAKLGLTQ
jgi:hypothetical protein